MPQLAEAAIGTPPVSTGRDVALGSPDALAERLSAFDSQGLADIAARSVLMERVDTKYIVPLGMIDELLEEVLEDFSVLAIDGRRVSRYATAYFDGADLRHYLAHHNGATERLKLRFRTYLDQGSSFLEVKRKNNKGRTVKRRVGVERPCASELQSHREFLIACGVTRIEELVETQHCEYRRAAFFCKTSGERFTVDFDLAFSDCVNGRRAEIEGIAVVELKQDRLNRDSTLSAALRRRRIHESGFSKYCVGMSLLRGRALKANRFKATLLKMQKINGKAPGEYFDV